MFEVSEGNISLQFQRLLQFIPVIELEGKAAKGGAGFRDDQYLLEYVLRVGVVIMTSELR